RAYRRKLACFPLIQPPELPELRRESDDLPLPRAVGDGIPFLLPLTEERRQRLSGWVPLKDFERGLPRRPDQEQAAIRPGIGGVPDPFVTEHKLSLLARDVIAIDGIGFSLDVVGAVIQGASIIGHKLERRLDLGLVLDHRERSAIRILEVEAWILLSVVVARKDEVTPVRRDADRGGGVSPAGHLHREPLRAVEPKDLAGAADRPAEIERLSIRGELAGARGTDIDHRLDPSAYIGGERGRRELR